VRPADRHEKIVRLVHKAGEIGVDELAQTLSASRETIRRDLSNLDAMGRLKKFHGGARVRSTPSVEPAVEGPFALRMAENLTAKRRIAYAAARLLAPGDSVFIDTGTTTLILAEALVDLPGRSPRRFRPMPITRFSCSAEPMARMRGRRSGSSLSSRCGSSARATPFSPSGRWTSIRSWTSTRR
jgi:hypothetical protein